MHVLPHFFALAHSRMISCWIDSSGWKLTKIIYSKHNQNYYLKTWRFDLYQPDDLLFRRHVVSTLNANIFTCAPPAEQLLWSSCVYVRVSVCVCVCVSVHPQDNSRTCNGWRPNLARARAKGEPLEMFKFWCPSYSGCGSTIIFPLSLTLWDMAFRPTTFSSISHTVIGGVSPNLVRWLISVEGSSTLRTPLPPVGQIWEVMLVWMKGNIIKIKRRCHKIEHNGEERYRTGRLLSPTFTEEGRLVSEWVTEIR